MKKKKFMMTKVKALLFAMFLGAPMTATAQSVAINETNFPDENFRNYLLEQDYGKDGVIIESEIKEIISIDVDSKNISSLKGIEHFTALTTLYCSANQLTALDVSKNTALQTLWCENNQLTALDVSKNTALTYLRCNDNQLTALDVSGCTALTDLNCSANQLTTLDVSMNTALTDLNCYNNQLTTLDVSKNTALDWLWCSDNQLTALDVSGCTALTDLNCYTNQLTTLDLSNNPKLSYLDCIQNQLTTLDVSKNTALELLHCSANQLTTLNVSKNTALIELFCSYNQITTLDVSGCTSLDWLSCENNQLTTLDVSGCTSLDWLSCENNQLTSLYVSNNTILTHLSCYRNKIAGEAMDMLIASLPTSGGRMYMYDNNEGNEGNVCTKSQVAIANTKGWTAYWLDDSGKWQKYEGYDEKPEGLDIDETNFPDVNFRNYLLGQEYGADEVLTDEEIEGIISLSVDGKGIASLKGIEYVTALTELHCADNRLTAIDLSGNTALTYVDCSRNQIEGESMDALIGSLPQTVDGKLNVHDDTQSDEGNVCTKEQVATANAKGWTAYLHNDSGEWQQYEGYVEKPEGLDIDETNFPDENFRSYLLSQEYGADEVLTDEEIEGIVSLSVDGKGIANLKGIEYFTALTELHCADNRLTAIDLSGNTALTALYCSGNQLTALDVTGNAALTTLDCSDNQIADLDVTGNAALAMLYCDYNQMAALNVSGCTALTELSCGNNRLTTLTTEGCTALTTLKCANNLLAALDVTGCEALTSINCSRNQIEGESMDALIASLPEVDGGVMNVYDNTKSDEGNVCYKPQVAAAGAKGWVLNWNNNGVWEAYEGTDDPTGISRPTKGTGNAPVYTLSGQKVTGSLKGKKGVYIIGGKKVVIK